MSLTRIIISVAIVILFLTALVLAPKETIHAATKITGAAINLAKVTIKETTPVIKKVMEKVDEEDK